ncbi:hypothetical protein ACFLXH_01855 [Chloroflexota bacterium]
MVRLEKSNGLGRLIRQDNLDELGISTWTKIKEAIQAEKYQEALSLVDYLNPEGKRLHDVLCDSIWASETYIADNLGEEALYQSLRQTAEPHYKGLQKLTPEEYMLLRAESERAQRSGPGEMGDICVTEEKDRYVISLDPCGSGGRMRREGRLAPPYNYGKTKKAHPWSWSKKDVPYYCLHCCIWSEIMPTEWFGYPSRITAYSDDPDAPCAFYIYKKPELIPEEYFTRIGKKKDLTRIKQLLQSK